MGIRPLLSNSQARRISLLKGNFFGLGGYCFRWLHPSIIGFADAQQETPRTAETEDQTLLEKAFRPGTIKPRVVPFQVSLEEAHRVFNQWHSSKWLSPGKLLSKGSGTLIPVLLPFWLFEACRPRRVHSNPWVSGGLCLGCMEGDQLAYRRVPRYPWSMLSMQVYASYKYRRDLVKAAQVPGILSRSRQITAEEAHALMARDVGWASREEQHEDVELDPPTMRQAIAWGFALRAIRRNEAEEASEALLATSGASSVRDVQVRVKTLRRRARLLYLPAYIATYTYGQLFNSHGERERVPFQALISALDPNSVAAERHYSPQKVQLAAASMMGGLGLVGLAMGVSGLRSWMDLLNVHAAFWVFIVCSAAGLAARMSAIMLREMEEEKRVVQEDSDFERFMGMGVGPLDALDEQQEALRVVAEWRRWEEADKWRWDEEKRTRWAETLWRSQQKRHQDILRVRAELAAAEARQRAEADAEAARRARYGHGGHHTRFSAGVGSHFSGGRGAGGKKDFLGYYAMLGLDVSGGAAITTDDVKRAFREAALRWHPDRQKVEDGRASQQAHERFRKLRTAYEVLRDPASRADYDQGKSDVPRS
eukprot:jgi/Botrbrau1/13048/Bobra.0187s0010.1